MRPDTTALGVDIGTILDRLGDGVTVQGSNGELLYANAAGARLCGFDSPEQLLRATPEEVDRALRPVRRERQAVPDLGAARPDGASGRAAAGGPDPGARAQHGHRALVAGRGLRRAR